VITAGLDIGSRTAKAVILGDDGVLAAKAWPVDDAVNRVAKRILTSALKEADISRRKLRGLAATGYGRKAVKAARREAPDTMCVARAVHHLCPEVNTVLDLGGLSARAIRIGENGAVKDYIENEKCAAGSGRFLEMVAEALEVPQGDIGELSLTSGRPLFFTSQCVVFAESEVISHVNAGADPADVLAGLHRSIAYRVCYQARKVDVVPEVAVVGGVAKNAGVVHFLEKTLDSPLAPLPLDPQIIAALGAALIARQ